MLSSPTRSFAAVLVSTLLLSPPSFAFEAHLTSEAARDAYFLGQRHDQALSYFFEKYRRHLPQPSSGPWIALVEISTPYAQAVDFCLRHTFNYTAQDAEQDVPKLPNTLRVSIVINFTPSFGRVVDTDAPLPSGNKKSYSLRSPDFWRDFSARLFDDRTEISPLHVQGHANYFYSRHGGPVMFGATIVLTYDPDKISSPSDVSVVVDTPDGQHVVVPFDLASVR